jgi:TetR/AcrR family transcriptional regulator
MSASASSLRQRRSGSDEVRERILVSAAIEFASLGFDGASTRTIAERSQAHQAQIGYHVGSKEDLWRATVDFLFARLRSHLDRALPTALDRPVGDPVGVFAEVIRRHVHHTAKHPELSRIMLMESAARSARVDWLLKNHVRPTLAALELMWADVRAAGGGRNVTAEEVFMVMVGLAPTPFAQAGLMRPLLGAKRCTPKRHAEVMVEWILG